MWNRYGEHKYRVGDLVQLQQYGPVYTITWRGWVRVPTLAGRHRWPVYRIDLPHWDCYYEDELGPPFSDDAFAYSPLWQK